MSQTSAKSDKEFEKSGVITLFSKYLGLAVSGRVQEEIMGDLVILQISFSN